MTHVSYGAETGTLKTESLGSAPAFRNIITPVGVSPESRISCSASRLFQTETIRQRVLSAVSCNKNVCTICGGSSLDHSLKSASKPDHRPHPHALPEL